MNEIEFKERLKALCLRHDLENGENEDFSYSGSNVYEFYCDENNLDADEFQDYLRKLNYNKEDEEPVKEVEYFISDEPIKLGDLVCDGHTALAVGVVTGIIEDSVAVDGGIPYALPLGRFLIKTPLKKLDVCEKESSPFVALEDADTNDGQCKSVKVRFKGDVINNE